MAIYAPSDVVVVGICAGRKEDETDFRSETCTVRFESRRKWYRWNQRRTQIQDAGNTIIDPSKHDYLRVYPAVGGTLTLNKWTKPENLGGRVFMVSDDEGFRDWRKNLVRDEVIDMPNLLVLQAIMRKQQELIIMHNSKPHIPQAQKELTLAEQRYEDMKKAYEAIEKQGKK